MLMGRFVKSSILEGVKTAYDLVKLDIKKEKNLVLNKEVDIGFGARRALSDKSGNGPVMLSWQLNFAVSRRKFSRRYVKKFRNGLR